MIQLLEFNKMSAVWPLANEQMIAIEARLIVQRGNEENEEKSCSMLALIPLNRHTPNSVILRIRPVAYLMLWVGCMVKVQNHGHSMDGNNKLANKY